MLGEGLTNLLSLLSQDEYHSVSQLAQQMKVSTKTVRQFVRQLDEVLSENGARILTKHGEGFMLAVEDFERFKLLFISEDGVLPNSSQERVQYLLEYLLNHEDYVKADELSDMLYISKKTLAMDIKKAEQILNEHELTLERKSHYGMRVAGNEFHIRLCIAKNQKQKFKNQNLPGLGNQEELNRISECILASLEQRPYRISDFALQNLIVHIQVAMRRIQSGQYVPLVMEDYRKWVGEEEYLLAKSCAGLLSRQFQIEFPEGEIIYMAIHLAGKEYGTGSGAAETNVIISSEIHEIVLEMLREIHEVFGINLQDDLELVMALGRHLIPLKVRLEFGMRLENPLLQEIKEQYSFAYAMAIQSCAVLERRFDKLLDPNEIAYIALALALSLERQRTRPKKKTVLLVCASGGGTAKLLAFKMQEMFRDCIEEIITCDEHSVKKQDFSKIDYLFATVPIRWTVPVPICEVKFSMGANDIFVVQKLLAAGEAADTIRYYPKDLFFTNVSFDTKEQVLSFMCREIAKVRPLPEQFFDAVMKREKLAQTYIGNLVAMPHPCKTMTEDTFVAICILDKPVLWNENQMVQLVFLVSVSNLKIKKIQDFYMVTAKLLLTQEYMEELLMNQDYATLESLVLRVSKQMEDI